MNTISHFHFIRPFWLLGLLAVLFLGIYFIKRQSQKNNWSEIIHPRLLPFLTLKNQQPSRKFWFISLILAWILAVFALAGPSWRYQTAPGLQKQDVLVIVLDLSLSMLADDIAPSRLERAKFKILDLLKKREEGLTGLIVYSGDAYVVTPITNDTNTIGTLIPSLDPSIMPVQGNRLDLAIKLTRSMLKSVNQAHGKILILSDDIDDSSLDELIDQVKQSGLSLRLLAIGTEQGAPIKIEQNYIRDNDGNIVIAKTELALFKKFAEKTHGKTIAIQANDADLNYLMTNDVFDDRYAESNKIIEQPIDDGFWLVLILLPLAAGLFRKGVLACCLALVFLPHPSTSFAGIWLTPDQKGQQLWNKNQYMEASKTFENPEWKGLAAYRNQDYQSAVKWLQKIDSIEAQYNLGNAYAKLGKIEDAIKTYESVLAKNPNHDDAKYNLNLLKNLPKQSSPSNKPNANQGNNQQHSSANNATDQSNQNQDPQKNNEANKNQHSMNNNNSQNASHANQGNQASKESADKNGESTNSDNFQNQHSNNAQENSNAATAEKDKSQHDNKDNAGSSSSTQVSKKNGDSSQIENSEKEMDPKKQEQLQALEQWLKRIPDDPGYFLRHKFMQQSRNRLENGEITQGSQAW